MQTEIEGQSLMVTRYRQVLRTPRGLNRHISFHGAPILRQSLELAVVITGREPDALDFRVRTEIQNEEGDVFERSETVWQVKIPNTAPASDFVLMRLLSAGALIGEHERSAFDYFYWEYLVRKPGGLHALQAYISDDDFTFLVRSGWQDRRCRSCNSYRINTGEGTVGYTLENEEYKVFSITRRCMDCGTVETALWDDLMAAAKAPAPGRVR